MEFQSNVEYLSAYPPKLENAGLEDCALPIEGIQSVIGDYKDYVVRKCEEVRKLDKEAFRLAAEKARAAADSLKEVINVKSILKDDGSCILDPGPTNGDLEDVSMDTVGIGQGGSCVDTHTGGLLEDGRDAVVDPEVETKEDKLLGGIDVGPKLGGDGCIKGDLLEPEASSGPHGAEDSDEESKGPTLTA